MNNKNRLRYITIDEHSRGPVYNIVHLTYDFDANVLMGADNKITNIPEVDNMELRDLISKSGYDLDGDIILIRDEHFVCDYQIIIRPRVGISGEYG